MFLREKVLILHGIFSGHLVFNNYILNIISAWANYSAILVTGRDSFNQNNAVTNRTFHCNQRLPLMELFCNFPLADL